VNIYRQPANLMEAYISWALVISTTT